MLAIKMLYYLSSLLLLTCLVFGDTLQLNKANFDHTVKDYKVVLVNFYADWCHFCRNLAPIYYEVAKALETERLSKKLAVAKVDSVAENELAGRFGINKFPTLKLFREGVLQKAEYRGARTLEAIKEFLVKQLADPYTVVQDNHEDIRSVATGLNEPHVLGFFESLTDSDAAFVNFRKVASALFGQCKFVAAAGGKGDAVGVYMKENANWPTDSPLTPYTVHDKSVDDILTYVKLNCVPIVRELTFTNAEEITEEGKPLLVLFYRESDPAPKSTFAQFAKAHLTGLQNAVNFVTADAAVFSHPLRHLDKSEADTPLFVLDSFQHMYVLAKPFRDAVTDPGIISQFVADLQSGKLHREFHYGPDQPQIGSGQQQQQPVQTAPPDSMFVKLAPGRNRYSLPHDEF